MPDTFDLIVIGAGSGGVATARRAASHGAKVLIIERGRVGGTCVLRGCVPKKLLMYASQYSSRFREAADFGWNLPGPATFSMAHWAQAKQAELERLEQVYRQGLQSSGVELISGTAQCMGQGQVRVGSKPFKAKHVVLATGSRPRQGVIPSNQPIPCSDDVLALTQLPQRATILGGGYIAVEFASILTGLGCQVSMRYRDQWPLGGFDHDLRQRVANSLTQQGIHLITGPLPEQLHADQSGWHMQLGHQRESTDFILQALGRVPNTEELGLNALGLTLKPEQPIPVDHRLQTPLDDIYAIGDLTGIKDLTPVAIAQGRWLADELFGHHMQPMPTADQVPTAVFSLVPAASIGLNEANCPAGTEVYEKEFKPMRLSFGEHSERCYLKVLADAVTGRILGVHMHGMDAPEIVQSLTIAVTAGLTKADFDRSMPLHPSTAEEFVLLGKPSRHT